MRRNTITLLAVLLLVACTSVQRQPVPVDAFDRAVIPGMPDIRDWGDEPSPEFQRDLVESVRQAREAGGPESLYRPMHALVLSGGGSNGAFGAGFLNGWTKAGTRPTFKLVTGISTGALIAPYAFLGPAFDDELERVFTTVTNQDVYQMRSPLTVFKKDSLARTDPLAATLEEVIDDKILLAIANEHRQGRRLFVGTTNLDAQRFVIWNMGAIADSGHPDSLELFRQVLLASASIPVAFPPVYFEVEVDGRRFDEMHVDGGVISELFLWGAMVDIADARHELQVDPQERARFTIYVIRNSQIDPAPKQIKPRLTNIASRSLLTLLKAVAIGDLQRIWLFAERNGIDLNYVGIPPAHAETPTGTFEPQDMRRLYEIGRSIALSDTPWRKDPPSWVQ
jgi:predicted acylesterase/phospholipase RssA